MSFVISLARGGRLNTWFGGWHEEASWYPRQLFAPWAAKRFPVREEAEAVAARLDQWSPLIEEAPTHRPLLVGDRFPEAGDCLERLGWDGRPMRYRVVRAGWTHWESDRGDRWASYGARGHVYVSREDGGEVVVAIKEAEQE